MKKNYWRLGDDDMTTIEKIVNDNVLAAIKETWEGDDKPVGWLTKRKKTGELVVFVAGPEIDGFIYNIEIDLFEIIGAYLIEDGRLQEIQDIISELQKLELDYRHRQLVKRS